MASDRDSRMQKDSKKPGSREPGFVSREAKRSIFGDNRSGAPVEVIVHTGANDVTVVARAGTRNGGAPRSISEVLLQVGVGGPTTEIVIEIFALEAPVRREHPFEAGAGGVAKARVGFRGSADHGLVKTEAKPFLLSRPGYEVSVGTDLLPGLL